MIRLARRCGIQTGWQRRNITIEAAFAAYWKNLVAKDPKLAAFPKSYQAQLRDAFVEGYKHGAADRQTEEREHGG